MYRFSWAYIKEKWIDAGFQKYFINTGWSFGSRILSMLVSLLATIFIARRLGPGNYGQLSYALSFIGIFGFIATLGLDGVLYRDLIKHPDEKEKYLGSAFMLKLIAGALSGAMAVIATILFTKDDVSKILIFILSGTFIFQSFQIITYDFQARVKSKYPAIIDFTATVILNSLKVLVIFFSKGVIYLSLILLLEPILDAIFYSFAYKTKLGGKISNWKFNKNIAKNLLIDSWPLMFTSAFVLVYSRIDQVFIKNMLDAHSVGIYSAAVTVAEVWYFIPAIIVNSVFPAIVNAKKTSEEIYYARLKKLSLMLLVISIVISLIVTLLAPFIIHIVYGAAFAGSTIILQIYVWACIGTFLGMVTDSYVVTENYRGILALKAFVPMVVNIILNLLWIPRYGMVGSAYATLISYSLGPLMLLCFKKTRKFFSLSDLFRTKISQ